MPGPGTGPRPGGWETLLYSTYKENGPCFDYYYYYKLELPSTNEYKIDYRC
jgi:hypothetical protein